jgi:hypothetical protein
VLLVAARLGQLSQNGFRLEEIKKSK